MRGYANIPSVVTDQGSAATGGPIVATNRLGDLAVILQVNPADVGQAQLTATAAERGHPLADGAVLVKLRLPTLPDLGTAVLALAAGAGGFRGSGDLVQEGLWDADVLVRTPDDPLEYRAVPFVFVASPTATFLGAPARDRRFGPVTCACCTGSADDRAMRGMVA